MIFKFKHEGGIDCSYNDETSTLSIGKSVCVSGVSKDSLEEAVSNLLILSNTYGCVSGDYEAVMSNYFMNKSMKNYREDDFTISLMTKAEEAEWKQSNTYVCPICGKTFTGYGNNPYPIAEEGRCCNECDTCVIMMRCWLYDNCDWLKSLVNELSRKHSANTGYCYVYEHTVAFTFYKDSVTKELAVVVCCDDEHYERIITGALQNWIVDNFSEKKLKGIRSWGKDVIWCCTAQKKNEFDSETRLSA